MKEQVLKWMDAIYLCCIWAAGISIVLMSLIIPWGIFARYVLGSGSQWPEPIAILFMMVFTFIGAAATYRAGGDIAVTMLTERLPRVPQRVLEVLVDITMAFMAAVVLWYGMRLCLNTMGQSISELSWLPVGVTYLSIPIGAGVTLLFVLERIAFGSQAHRAVVRIGEADNASLAQEGAN